MKHRTRHLSFFIGLIGAILLLLLSSPGAANAAEFRAGGDPSLRQGERIDDDLFIAGGTISIDGEVTRDLIVAGGTIDVSGPVGGNLNVTGGTVTVNAPVGGSVRVLAGNVTIRGPVGWDVQVAGGDVTLSQGSQVQHDVWAGAGTLRIDGSVGRDVHGNIGSLRINGTVGGNVRAEVDNTLRLGPSARVAGNLEYASDEQAVIDPGATIGGQTSQRDPGAIRGRTVEVGGIGWLGGFLIRLAWALVAGTLLVLLLPRQTAAVTDTLREEPLVSFGWGVVLLFLVPVLVVVLLITVIGIPLALILAALYWIALYLSQIIVGIALVRLALPRILPGMQVGTDRMRLWVSMLVGVSIVLLIRLLPIPLGWTFWISLLIGIFALGAIWTALSGWGRRRRGLPPAAPAAPAPIEPVAGPV